MITYFPFGNEMCLKLHNKKIIDTRTTVSFPFTFKLDQIFKPENNVHQPHRQTIDCFVYGTARTYVRYE